MKKLIIVVILAALLFAPFGSVKAATQAELIKSLQEQINILIQMVTEMLKQQAQSVQNPVAVSQIYNDYLAKNEQNRIDGIKAELDKRGIGYSFTEKGYEVIISPTHYYFVNAGSQNEKLQGVYDFVLEKEEEKKQAEAERSQTLKKQEEICKKNGDAWYTGKCYVGYYLGSITPCGDLVPIKGPIPKQVPNRYPATLCP
jgi:hypothetical protein